MTQLYAGATAHLVPKDGPIYYGFYRRTVGDENWQHVTDGLPADLQVQVIEIDPKNPDRILVGSATGLYLSENAGQSFKILSMAAVTGGVEPVIWSILLHAGDANTLYVGTAPHAVYRSRDGGNSFEKLSMPDPSGLVDMGFDCRLIRLTADAVDPNKIYAGVEVGGLLFSPDGGETWQDCCADLLRLAGREHLKSQLLSDTPTEGMMDTHAMACSPSHGDTVILATRMGLFESKDLGQNWRDMEIADQSPLSYARDVVVSPQEPEVLYGAFSDKAGGYDGALYRSENMGQSWQRFDHGHDIASTLMKISASAQSPGTVAATTRRGQIITSTDNGASWQDASLPDNMGSVYAVAIC